MVRVSVKADDRVDTFAKKLVNLRLDNLANKYGQLGVEALSENTPVDTGRTAASWSYTFQRNSKGFSITWTNSNTSPTGCPIVIFIQYGHTLPGGGYVQGVDIVNPAMKPIFENLAKKLWLEVTNL